MPLGKMNKFGNQQAIPPQNQGSQLPSARGQFGLGNPVLGRGLQRFLPMMGGQGGLPMPPGLTRIMNGLGGGQGYVAPGYPPQGFGQQQPPQQPMPQAQSHPFQGLPSQAYPTQGYAPQGYNQGYGGQMPVQPAGEEPKNGGIKGFISNLMAKRKR